MDSVTDHPQEPNQTEPMMINNMNDWVTYDPTKKIWLIQTSPPITPMGT